MTLISPPFCLHPAQLCGMLIRETLGHSLNTIPFELGREQRKVANDLLLDDGLKWSREHRVYSPLVLFRASSSLIFSNCSLYDPPQETQHSHLSVLLSTK